MKKIKGIYLPRIKCILILGKSIIRSIMLDLRFISDKMEERGCVTVRAWAAENLRSNSLWDRIT